MRWLIPVGIVLILAGGAGAVAAYVQSAQADGGAHRPDYRAEQSAVSAATTCASVVGQSSR